MKKRKEFFDELARQWDVEHNGEEEKKRTWEYVCANIPLSLSETVLDVGCGTSRLVPVLQRFIGKKGKLIELDISLEMLKIGKNRYIGSNLVFIQGDGHLLPLKDHSIDTVICMAFFPHLADKERGMQAFARVLKPGGRLYIAHQMSREELNRFHGQVEGPVGDDLLPEENTMRGLFQTAGFIKVEIREMPGLYLASGCRQPSPDSGRRGNN
jgi:ubiquinone/menaquinone biosynthesis C-methylase UbiE